MAKFEMSFDEALMLDGSDFRDMKFQDLQRVASALAKESRRRVSELQKMEKEWGKSPALASFERFRDGEMYSARYKGRLALLDEIAQMWAFLDDKTGTAEGYRQHIQEAAASLGVDNLTGEEWKEFGKTFRRLEEHFANAPVNRSSRQIEKDLKIAIRSKDGEINWKQVERSIIARYDPAARIRL